MTKPYEIRELTDEEFAKMEKDVREELFNIQIQVSTQQNTNYGRIKQLKKDLARINTIKREREAGSRS